MVIGPQVAFVDDVESEIRPLDNVIKGLNAGTVFFDASPARNKYPEKPLETVQLLFLDLYYTAKFDPFISAQWVQSIIAPNTKYTLVIWSKDTHEKDQLLNVLDEIELTPDHTEIWQKTDYDLPKHNFSPMITELISSISKEGAIEEDILYGEILDVSDDGIIINCRLNDEHPTFQTRRFDKGLLANIENLTIGTIVRIHIYTKPGARLIDIFEERKDKSDLFIQPDFFKGLEGNAFFTKG